MLTPFVRGDWASITSPVASIKTFKEKNTANHLRTDLILSVGFINNLD
jgi:hypothetical protein